MAVSKKPARIPSKKSSNITENQASSQPGNGAPQAAPKPSSTSQGLHIMPPRDEQVRRRAYEIYESQGRPEGRHEEHWRQAEKEVRGRSA
jgi:hypothetical protein